MKLWKRILSCFLALLLTVYLLPVQVMAEELGDLWPLTTENIAETPPDVIGEVLERRGENQKEFLLANGVRQVVIYPAAVHYQKDGQWKDIDNRLLPATTRDGETVYQNVAGMWDVSVPAELNTARGITVSRNGYSLSFYLTGQLFEDGGAISESGSASMGEELPGEDMICVPAGESTAAISSTTSTLADDDQLQPEAALKNQRSKALYQNVYHDTDVTYDLDSNRLKESLILRSYPKEMLGYRYRLETDSLRLELQEDNRILAYAKDAGPQDEPVFYMPAPYLLDAENAYSNDIKVTLEENDKGYELRYHLPQDWMADAAYPVVMDPVVQPVSNTFTIRDKTVTQRNPPAYDAISLDAGYSTNRGRERIYIRFKNIPSLSSADVVVGAKVLLYKYSGSGSISGNYMTAHQVKSMWDSETITWANRADYVHTSEDYQFVAGQTWHSWDITNIAQKWYEPSGNTGVMLRMSEAVEGGTTTKTASFYSSDYSNTQQCPMLVISYINNCGLESTWDYTSSSAGRAGTGYVNDYTGNLVWVHTGLGFSGNRMPVSINAVYNANDKGNKAYGLGYGWRTNYNQRVEQITLGGTTYYRWEDEDGTRHYFMKKSAGLYVDELEPTRQLTDTGSGTKKFCITEKSGSKRYFDASGRLAGLSNNQATASSVSIYYASQDHISVISDGVGRKYRFSYDSSGNLTKISFTGTGTTELSAMTYQVSGDNLRTIGYPDGKNATFSYGAEHLLTGAQDADGYKLAYTYNTTTNGQPNRIATIKEYDGSTAGGTLSLEYAHNQTTFTDHNGNKEIMQFNRYGSTLSVQDGLGRAQFSQYANSTDLAKASQLTLSSKLQNTVINLLESGSLESKTGWTVSGTGTGSWSYSQAQAYYGRTSLSIQNNTLKPVSSAVRALEPGKTYTFSAYVRAGASGARIGLLKPGSTEPLVVSTAAPANNTWTRLQVTYTLPSGSAYASVLPFLQNTSGTAAYFDALQLEQTASPSRYNLVENSDFSFNSAWTPNSSCASTDQIITYTSSPTENSDKRVMRITGDPNKHKYGNQILSGLGGAAGDVYTVSGWAKGDCVYTDDSNRRMYALMVRFYYTDGTTSDNFIKFNPDTDSQSSWQFVSGVVKAAKPYSQMGIYTAYVQTLNTVYFDNVQLFKEEFGHSYDYDSNGNLISVVDLQKNKTKYDYDSNNNLVKMTLPSGASQSYTYDSYHNVIKAVSPEGVTSRFTYDTYGNIKTVKLGSGSQTISASAVYTANGDQVSSVTDALGQTTTYGYDTQTGVLNWTQAPGETASTRTNYTHDQLYRTIKVQQSTAAVDYTYSKDLLSAISTASGTDYSFTYGVFDLTTAVKAGSRTLISHSYTNDQNRRLSRSVYGNGDAVSYSYDSFGRTTAVTYGDTGSTVSYAYDANSNLGQLTDGISGRVNRYSYDFLDRLMRYEESGDGYSNIVQWGYDDENNLSSQTQTLNGSTYASTYAYDKDNRLTKATEGTISANYTYDSFSRMTGLTAKNGSTSVVNTAVTYVDPSSSATSTQVKTWNNGKAAYTYTYDNKGNITSISDGSKTVTYAYDAFGRLVDVYDPVAKQHCVYTYDDGGNLLQQVIYKPKQSSGGGGGDIVIPVDPPVEPPIEVIVAAAPDDYGYYLSATVNYTYGDANWPDLLTAFNGKSITYDAIGNPLSDGTWTYAWQHGRQLASMSKSGSSITYGYDADGKRISKTVNGTTYNYAYLGDTLTDLSWGSNRMHFTYDSLGPASVTYNGNRYFYLKNAQGDVTGLVNASGTQVVSYTYDPWGAPMSVSGSMSATLGAANPLRYRGYVYDTETGFYYLTSRYYNPVWERFINADTAAVVAASPDKANWDKNLFAYCDNDPINRQDDEGDLWKWLPFKESGDWGFVHRAVQFHIVLTNSHMHLGSEISTADGKRMDIYSYPTSEVWEVKPYSGGMGYATAAVSLSKYIGNYYNTQLIVPGAANQFMGSFPLIYGEYSLQVEYFTPAPGVILYDFNIKNNAATYSIPVEKALMVPIVPFTPRVKGCARFGGKVYGFGGGGWNVCTFANR